MRAAEAARNTSDLIESTVKRINDGSDLVIKTNEPFSEVTASSSKVGELVEEIAAASNEQAQGIEQVNSAVTDMDKVTQQNAANAEESASASEQMNAQAEEMKSMVENLATLIGGTGKAKRSQIIDRHAVRREFLRSPGTKILETIPRQKTFENPQAKPEAVIPFEEDEFKDF